MMSLRGETCGQESVDRKTGGLEMMSEDYGDWNPGKMFSESGSELCGTDAEFVELFERFAGGEVAGGSSLDGRTRMMAILSALLGCQGLETFRMMLPGAVQAGVTPVEIKEIVYQATAYLGMGRTLEFLTAVNTWLMDQGIALPLEVQGTVTVEDRVEKGEQAQVDIFGEHMRGFSSSGPEESRHINRWLSGNCFGDYYTRKGLDYRQREMITFCFLAAHGGCEPQLVSHAAANMRIGNDRHFLIEIISQCLPYVGYPRSLNALRCVNEAAK